MGCIITFWLPARDHMRSLPPSPWGIVFALTADGLLTTEAIGAYVGIHFLWIAPGMRVMRARHYSLRPICLAEKPSDCVVWIGLNKETLDLIRRRWTLGLSCGAGERQPCRCRTSPNIASPALHLLWLPQV